MVIKKIDKELFPALGGQKPKGQPPREYVRAESKKRNMVDDIDGAVKCYDEIISEYCENEGHSPSFAENTLPDREVCEVFFKDNGMFYDKEPISFDYFKYLSLKYEEKKKLTALPCGYKKRIDSLWSSARTVRNGTGIYRLKEPLQYLGMALIAALITYICYVLMDKGILALIAWGAFFIAGAATLFLLGASFISLVGGGSTIEEKQKLKNDFLNALRYVRFRALWYQQITGGDAIPSYLIEAEKNIFETVKPVKKILKKNLYMNIRYKEDVAEDPRNLFYKYETPEYKFTVSKSEAKKAIEKADAACEANDYSTAARNYLKACKGGYDDHFGDAWSMIWKLNDNEDEEKIEILNELMRFYNRTHRSDIRDDDMLKKIYQYLSYGYQKEIEEEIGGFLRLYDPAYALIYKTELRPTVEKAGFYYRKLAEMGDTEHLGLTAKAMVLLADNSRELNEALEWMKKLEASDGSDNLELFDSLREVVANTVDKIEKNESDANYVSVLTTAAEMGIDICKRDLAIYYYNRKDYYKAYTWINKTIMPLSCRGTPNDEYEKWFNDLKRKITTAYTNSK